MSARKIRRPSSRRTRRAARSPSVTLPAGALSDSSSTPATVGVATQAPEETAEERRQRELGERWIAERAPHGIGGAPRAARSPIPDPEPDELREAILDQVLDDIRPDVLRLIAAESVDEADDLARGSDADDRLQIAANVLALVTRERLAPEKQVALLASKDYGTHFELTWLQNREKAVLKIESSQPVHARLHLPAHLVPKFALLVERARKLARAWLDYGRPDLFSGDQRKKDPVELVTWDEQAKEDLPRMRWLPSRNAAQLVIGDSEADRFTFAADQVDGFAKVCSKASKLALAYLAGMGQKPAPIPAELRRQVAKDEGLG